MGKNYFITKSKNFPHLADLCSKNDENTIEKQVINPFNIKKLQEQITKQNNPWAIGMAQAQKEGLTGQEAIKRKNEIAEAIKEKEGIQKSDFGKYLKELNKYNGKKK